MSIFNKLKNWFKKEEPKEEYYIDYRKLRQRELDQDFSMINHDIDLRYVFEKIPYRWVYHIDKCVNYNEIEIATAHLLYWSKMCEFAYVTYGIKCDIKPLWDKIKTSKLYKQYMIEKKMELIKKDFE